MPLPDSKYLIDKKNASSTNTSRTPSPDTHTKPSTPSNTLTNEPKDSKKHRLVIVVEKLISDLDKINKDVNSLNSEMNLLGNQKSETKNLKDSYKQFVEDTNANWSILNEEIKSLKDLNKTLNNKLEQLENI